MQIARTTMREPVTAPDFEGLPVRTAARSLV